ncbi:MAG: hypothetical protein PHF56_12740 [Desulfuromonadaceae bacterium]|nr:hypothetical protein [Desulfuromonadaceae bacterium]
MPNLTITNISSIKVADGGLRFAVQFAGPLTPNRRALIEFGTMFGAGVNRTATVDVTASLTGKTTWTGNLQSAALLGDVLACLGRNQLLEKKVKARGVLWTSDRDMVVSATSQTFDAPVRPVSECSPRLAEQEFKLRYTGVGTGCLIFNIPGRSEIAANYYFVYGGNLVTDPMQRGFDCTTFLMAALKQFSNVTTPSGEVVAARAGMLRILNKVPRAQIVAEITANHAQGRAIILVHNGTTDVTHHCVLVRDGFVYEFNKPAAYTVGLTPAGSDGGFITELGKWRANDASSVYSLFA